MKIILASTSKYRKAQLERLNFDFECQDPAVNEDEVKKSIHNPSELAQSLAMMKAQSVASKNQDSLVIGGDQVAHFNGLVLGKPKDKELALKQLKMFNGKTHELLTAICIIHKGRRFDILDRTKLTMRKLSDNQLRAYIEIDQPLDCAGSYKLEKLGISLFSKIESNDMSAIEGIPLMAVSEYLFDKVDHPFWCH